MTEITRRRFVGGSMAIVGGLIAPGRMLQRVPVTHEERRVVIVGSGFGGGVAALRLAEAGVTDIVVLERGKRWPSGPNAKTFPSTQNNFKGALFYESAPAALPGLQLPNAPSYAGLLEAHVAPNMLVLNAAGVGGGSLAYQGMTLQPARAVFEETFPAALNYDQLDAVYYPRVAQMLQIATAPEELVRSASYKAPRVFRRRALAAGYTVDKIPMPIDWNYALAELRGEMRPSYTNGDCALGVNNGGKHSVDVTYIARAEATGRVDVRPLHNVRRVARTKAGRWRVEVNRTDVHGNVLERKVITADSLILAAGSVNTTRILLRAAYEDAIPDLPDGVGRGWGSNADRIVTWTSPGDDFGAIQGGPVVFGSKEWHNPKRANTVIQASVPPVGVSARTTIMVGFGVSEARGFWIYNPVTDDITLRWKHEADASIHRRIWTRMRAIAGPEGVLGDTFTPAPMTWHPLGGACMNSVCDLDGRVRDQPGLYVLDGALMPGTTAACNPSMTIAALAERALDNLARTDFASDGR